MVVARGDGGTTSKPRYAAASRRSPPAPDAPPAPRHACRPRGGRATDTKLPCSPCSRSSTASSSVAFVQARRRRRMAVELPPPRRRSGASAKRWPRSDASPTVMCQDAGPEARLSAYLRVRSSSTEDRLLSVQRTREVTDALRSSRAHRRRRGSSSAGVLIVGSRDLIFGTSPRSATSRCSGTAQRSCCAPGCPDIAPWAWAVEPNPTDSA